MYEVGKLVLYGTEGVCSIAEIQVMKVGHQRSKYYVLRPVNREGATVFVPVDNEALLSKMRPLLTAEEIEDMLRRVQQEERLWIDNPAERKVEFQRILLSGDRYELLRMMRGLYETRKNLQSRGRRLRTNDEQILRDSEKLIDDEFSTVLGIRRREIPAYIRAKLEGI